MERAGNMEKMGENVKRAAKINQPGPLLAARKPPGCLSLSDLKNQSLFFDGFYALTSATTSVLKGNGELDRSLTPSFDHDVQDSRHG
jgi:hypothetical protein